MTKIQMVELRNGFYLKTEPRSDSVGSQAGWL